MPIDLDRFEKLRKPREMGGKCDWDLLVSMITTPMTVRQIQELTASCTEDGEKIARPYLLAKLKKLAEEGKLVMRSDGSKYFFVNAGVYRKWKEKSQ